MTPVETPEHPREHVSTPRNRDAFVHRSGRTIPIDDTTAPVLDEAGRVLGGVLVFRDPSEQRRAEAEIQRLNVELERRVVERTHQLEAANEELEAFNYSVAHDLRAPLRGIDAFSQMLIEEHLAHLAPDALEYLRRIRRSTARMGQLIDDLLRLSRIARHDLQLTSTSISRLAREITGTLRGAEPGRSIEIDIEDGIEVVGDAHLIRIALENVLQNAWKFTSKTAEPRIHVGHRERDGKTEIVVSDNGAGFDMAHAQRLFTAFHRLHAESEFPGAGVGLAIVQRIVNRHGGRVRAEGFVGSGATISFTI